MEQLPLYEKPSKNRSVILGGLIIGALSGIPGISSINCCCCAGILGGGALAVYFYRQEFHDGDLPMESSDALIVGLIAGILGAVISVVLSTAFIFLFGPTLMKFHEVLTDRILQLMQRVIERLGLTQEGTEDLHEKIEQAYNESREIGGILRSLVVSLILYPIFSLLGGLIGFSLLGKKKDKPQFPSQPPHPY